MLEFSHVSAGYGRTEVLFDVSFAVRAGEFVTVLGRNGMGKTTLVRVLMGLLPRTAGNVKFKGTELGRMPAHRVARLGLGWVPEGRHVCPNLTVRENLIATARAVPMDSTSSNWTLEKIYALFPRLEERSRNLGSQLSGGEQQLLAIGRALMTNPQLLVLDEATEGLAPLIRQEVWRCLKVLREEKLAVLLIDKNIEVLSRLADRHVIVERGRVVWTGNSDEFLSARKDLDHYLGV